MVVPAYSRLKCGEMSRGLDADSGDLQSQEHKEAETVDAREGLRRGISGLLLQSKWLMDHGGALIDGCKENPMCYRRTLQQGSRATDRFPTGPTARYERSGQDGKPEGLPGHCPGTSRPANSLPGERAIEKGGQECLADIRDRHQRPPHRRAAADSCGTAPPHIVPAAQNVRNRIALPPFSFAQSRGRGRPFFTIRTWTAPTVPTLRHD